MDLKKQVPTTILLALLIGCKNPSTNQNTNSEGLLSKNQTHQNQLPLNNLNLPQGFQITLYADKVPGARSMTAGDDGTIYVGTRNENKVYALIDSNQDMITDEVRVIANELNSPNGVAYKEGDLYVAEIHRLLVYRGIGNGRGVVPEPEVIYNDYPKEFHHGWKYIGFGPDNKLYVPVGAPCNICDSTIVDKRYASITRMNPDGSEREIFAHGVRNTVGFTWHPKTKVMWFTDNGRDMMGDDLPPCELNKAPKAGMHFGYPFCHGGTIPDPEYGLQKSCDHFTAPEQNLEAHVAPLGIKFTQGIMFPNSFKNKAFIAEHGSWNRTKKSGYRISMVEIEEGKATDYKTFIDGWLNEDTQERFGRPVDILFLKDGSMLISDDYAGVIYRVTYNG